VESNAAVVYRQADIRDEVTEPRRQPLCHSRQIPETGVRPPENVVLGAPVNVDAYGTICNLLVIIDHTFFHEVALGDTALAYSIVTQHIAQADFTFRATDMNRDGMPENFGFQIDRIRIYGSATDENYQFRDTTLVREEILNAIARENFDQYCLVVTFLFRDMG